MHPNAIIERNDSLMSAPLDQEIVFLNPATDKYIALDQVGRRVWELLADPRSLSDLIAMLAEEFDGPHHQIAADVAQFLDTLESEKMIRVVDRPAP